MFGACAMIAGERMTPHKPWPAAAPGKTCIDGRHDHFLRAAGIRDQRARRTRCRRLDDLFSYCIDRRRDYDELRVRYTGRQIGHTVVDGANASCHIQIRLSAPDANDPLRELSLA
jgi:hypothetical protein